MTDSRIEDLRRRVDKDPASIAFAQLGEECRRAGRFDEAIRVCQVGLAIHPTYLSARVTLARALAQVGNFDAARREFSRVLEGAPGNLAAVRGLADLLRRQGFVQTALDTYQIARRLAPNDPEIERSVTELEAMLAEHAAQAEQRRLTTLLDVFEQWLAAIHVTRAERHA